MAQYLNRNCLQGIVLVYHVQQQQQNILAVPTQWRICRMRQKLITVGNVATVDVGFVKRRNNHQIKTLSSSTVIAVIQFNRDISHATQHMLSANINHSKWTGKGMAVTHTKLQNKRNLSWFSSLDYKKLKDKDLFTSLHRDTARFISQILTLRAVSRVWTWHTNILGTLLFLINTC